MNANNMVFITLHIGVTGLCPYECKTTDSGLENARGPIINLVVHNIRSNRL